MQGMYTRKTSGCGHGGIFGAAEGRYGKFVFCMMGFVLFLADTRAAADGVRAGLELCAGSLIPSLFPFLVLSPMLSSGAVSVLCRRGSIAGALFCAFVLGMAAGFPIGALILVSLYEGGVLSREDAQNLLGVCSGASAAFCVGYVGEALCASVGLGWLIWCIQLLLCLVGFLVILSKIRPTRAADIPMQEPPALTECIRDAVPRMLSVSGTVVFFSVLRAFAVRYIGGIGAAVLCGVCEITGGLHELRGLADAGLLSVGTAIVIGAGLLGFGGICVLAQITQAVSHAGLSMKRCLLTRLRLGIAAAALSFVLYMLCS